MYPPGQNNNQTTHSWEHKETRQIWKPEFGKSTGHVWKRTSETLYRGTIKSSNIHPFFKNCSFSKNLDHLQKPVDNDEIPKKKWNYTLMQYTILGLLNKQLSSCMNKPIVIYGNVQFIWLCDELTVKSQKGNNWITYQGTILIIDSSY